MNVIDYMTRRYGNQAPRYWWGDAHRKMLLSSGKYIETSQPNKPRWVGEPGPELVNLRAASRSLHHRGSAIWDPDTGEHYPGCGCP